MAAFLREKTRRIQHQSNQNIFFHDLKVRNLSAINDVLWFPLLLYDKGEPIYITVSIDPLEELNNDIDPETLAEIPLDCITKY